MLERNFYLITKSKKEYKGNPIFFNYEFEKKSCESNQNIKNDYFYYTQCKEDELLFICKHKSISFDFVDISSGEYFVSHRFRQALKKIEEFQLKTVKFVSAKGEEIAEKEYFILRVDSELNAVDIQKSTINVSKEFSFLEETRYLALRSSIIGERELFCINNDSFAGMLFCSEKFKSSAEALGVDVSFISVQDAGEYLAKK